MQARANGSDGDGEDESDLLVGELLELAEDDDLFEEQRKCIEAIAESGEGFGAGQVLGRPLIERGRVEGLVGRVDGDEALAAFEMTPELAAGDAAEPGGECSPALGVVSAGVAEEGEEDLLGDLFRNGGVAAEAKGETVDERACGGDRERRWRRRIPAAQRGGARGLSPAGGGDGAGGGTCLLMITPTAERVL